MLSNTDLLVQNWFMKLDRRTYAVIIGLVCGVLGGTIGLMLSLLGPVLTTGALLGLLVGLYILTNIHAALYLVITITILLPFGTLPFSIGFTPTLLDAAIGAFVLVYIMQWMTGKRHNVRLTIAHGFIAIYVLWILLAFALGLRYASPTPLIMRQFAETLLAFGLVFIVVDLIRNPVTLQRIVLVVILVIGLQATIALGLYVLPDDMAERLLRTLSRIGYPAGGIIRYIEQNPSLPERAIGTWVDPNTLGGALAIAATMIAPQVFAKRPVIRWRWLTFIILVLVGLALLLTYSRTSMLAFGVGLFIIAVVRYRRFIPLMILAGILLLLLPQTQAYIERFFDAFTGGDLATQMRIGETSDSLRLISRYPLFGVGFTGTPEIDIYTNVANMYLIMANQIGLTGVVIYLVTMGSVLFYGVKSWAYARKDDLLASLHLGYHAALITALVNGIGDLYYFRIDFQGSITLFWLTVALALATSQEAFAKINNHRFGTESTLDKNDALR